MDRVFNSWSDITKNGFNSWKELSEINLHAMERMGEQQVAWFSMFADLANRQMEVASEAKNYQDVLSAQANLANEMGNKALEIANNTADIFNDSRDQMANWFEKSLKGADAAAKSAVKKTAAAA